MSNPKLIVGRVTMEQGGITSIAPLHRSETLDHQRKVAALIAAAYLYRDLKTVRALEDLKQAALEL